MKRLIAIIVLCFVTITCGTYRSANWKNIGTDGSMIETVEKRVSIKEMYQICEKENLSTNLNEWARISYYDNDTVLVSQWFFIKDTDTNKFYLLTKDTDSTFIIKIREIKPE